MYKINFKVSDNISKEELLKVFENAINNPNTTSFSIKKGVDQEEWDKLIDTQVKNFATSMNTTVEKLSNKFKKMAQQMVKNSYFIVKDEVINVPTVEDSGNKNSVAKDN